MSLTIPFPGQSAPSAANQGLTRSTALSRVLNFENALHRRLGMVRPQRYTRLLNYYMGTNLPPDNVLQPLGINFVRTIVDKHTSYFLGQYTTGKDIIGLRVAPKNPDGPPEDPKGETIKRYFKAVFAANHANLLLRRTAHNSSLYGDGILRLRWDAVERRVVLEDILPEYFHCRWDVNDMTRLTEVIVAYPIDRGDAYEKYGVSGNEAVDYNMVNPMYLPGFGIYWEHWTPTSYRIWIDDYLIQDGPNPYMRTDGNGNLYPGLLPFLHIPNQQVGGEFWGFSDAEHVLALQDEVNRRMADMGDIVNNFAHPIVTLKKFSGNQGTLTVGPDAVWDLGREGEAEILSWKGPGAEVMAYIESCKQMLYDTANMPEVAFGRGLRGGGSGGKSGGSSGIALQLAMMPIVERAMEKRLVWTRVYHELLDMIALIHAVQDPASLPFAYEDLANYLLAPVFASVLPRDRLQAVNENVALSGALLRSTPRALEDLGEENLQAEYKAIQRDARFKASLGLLTPPVPGGKNSDRGRGGSPGLGGPGAKNSPGSGAKDANGGS